MYVSGNASTRTAVTYATIAYRAATGARIWASLHNPGEYSFARAMALSPDGAKLFVTGYSYLAGGYHYATIACNAVTGAWLWARRYTGPGSPSDIPRSIAVSPGGGSVFVTGTSFGSSQAGTDYVTVAYAS